jgi:hypothetical protein
MYCLVPKLVVQYLCRRNRVGVRVHGPLAEFAGKTRQTIRENPCFSCTNNARSNDRNTTHLRTRNNCTGDTYSASRTKLASQRTEPKRRHFTPPLLNSLSHTHARNITKLHPHPYPHPHTPIPTSTHTHTHQFKPKDSKTQNHGFRTTPSRRKRSRPTPPHLHRIPNIPSRRASKSARTRSSG